MALGNQRFDLLPPMMLLAAVLTTSPGCRFPVERTASKPIPTPDDTTVSLKVPPVYRSRQQLRGSERELKSRLIQDPQDVTALWHLADCYARQGLKHSALKHYEQALDLAPKQQAIRVDYARLLWEDSQTDAALSEVRHAVKQDETLAQGHALHGEILRFLGKNAEAIEAYERGWRCRPPSIDAGLGLAQWDRNRDRQLAAIDRLRLCLVYDPARSDCRVALAEILQESGRPQQAAEQWEILANRGEAEERPFVELAKWYHLQGKSDVAEQYLADAQRLAPGSALVESARRSLEQRLPAPETVARDFRPLLPTR